MALGSCETSVSTSFLNIYCPCSTCSGANTHLSFVPLHTRRRTHGNTRVSRHVTMLDELIVFVLLAGETSSESEAWEQESCRPGGLNRTQSPDACDGLGFFPRDSELPRLAVHTDCGRSCSSSSSSSSSFSITDSHISIIESVTSVVASSLRSHNEFLPLLVSIRIIMWLVNGWIFPQNNIIRFLWCSYWIWTWTVQDCVMWTLCAFQLKLNNVQTLIKARSTSSSWTSEFKLNFTSQEARCPPSSPTFLK